jgi:hypothetical protein
MFAGRGFMMNYAKSEPEYKNCFEIFELEDAIFQPSGGGHLENHRYAGRQNIIRSESDLKSTYYDQAQVAYLLRLANSTDFDPSFHDQEGMQQLAKFQAMGLSPQAADYIREKLFKLVEMAVMANGQRYYIVFSPWYEKWCGSTSSAAYSQPTSIRGCRGRPTRITRTSSPRAMQMICTAWPMR